MENLEIDRQIAEKVMGWKVEEGSVPCWIMMWVGTDRYIPFRSFSPSTNIAHAFEVVEKLQKLYPDLYMSLIFPRVIKRIHYGFRTGSQVWEADTPAMAICLAALKAIND